MKTCLFCLIVLVPCLFAFAQPTLLFTSPVPDTVTHYTYLYLVSYPLDYRLARVTATSVVIMTGPYSTTAAYTVTKTAAETGVSQTTDVTGDGISEMVLTKYVTVGNTSRTALRIVNPVTNATYLTLDDANYSYVGCSANDWDGNGNIELMVYRYAFPLQSNSNLQYLFYSTQGHTVAPDPGGHPLPATPTLLQNFPNPFNGGTHIQYDLSIPTNATISIFDVSGRLVKAMAMPNQPAGHYDFLWDGTNQTGSQVASGAYFYQLSTPSSVSNRKMILIR